MVAFFRSDYLWCIHVCVWGGGLIQHRHVGFHTLRALAGYYICHVFLRFQQILLYYMEHNEYELVMETCKRHG
jgi:hypothetical protein